MRVSIEFFIMRRLGVVISIIFLIQFETCLSLGTRRLRKREANEIKELCIKKKIAKCCLEDQYITWGKKCEKPKVGYENLDFSDLPLYDKYLDKTGKSLKDVYTVVPGKFAGDKLFKRMVRDYARASNHNYYLTEVGILVEEIPNIWNWRSELNTSRFCVDYELPGMDEDIKSPQPKFWSVGAPLKLEKSDPPFRTTLITAGLFTSCFFLGIVLLVYLLLPELRNLGGLVLMAYVGSMMSAFLLLAILRLKEHAFYSCLILTHFIYFFLISSFCWMNVMSLDIWWTFRGYAKARFIHRRGELFKFRVYCSYAWGLPLAMTVAVAVLNQMDLSATPWFIKPNLSTTCFLHDEPKVLYLYVPMLILIVCNWMLFMMTVFNMWRLHRNTNVLDSAASGTPAAHRKQRYRLLVYLKLSIIMGINWGLEVVSYYRPNDTLWYFSDVFNVLIGLSIFLIFVCKRKILAKLVKSSIHLVHRCSNLCNPSRKYFCQTLKKGP